MPKNDNVISEQGTITYIRYPLIKISGLPSVQLGDLLQCESGSMAQVLSFDEQNVEAMSFSKIPPKAGAKLVKTSKKLSIQASNKFLGHVIDPLGEALMGEPIKHENPEEREINIGPRPLSDRRAITNRLHTATNIIDTVIPIAKGQREIITGDRNTGKSTFAKSLVKSQAVEGSVVIYAMIAKKSSNVKALREFLEEHKIADKVIIVASLAQDPVSLIVLTPFTAMTLAEHFRDQGNDVLLILDDLSSHAIAYREISLLNKQFPGRDSYPGDIFYLHARLLERAGTIANPQENPEKETVSITCLPIAETNNNDLTDYIISNLISITDGHILFDTNLFQQGKRPAVNPSLSVTRVGKQTQNSLQREVTRKLTTFLSKYDKASSMTHFAAELSQESQNMIRQGSQLWAFFTQTTHDIIPNQIQLLFIAIIWLNWFVNVKNKTLVQYRDKLNFHYANEKAVKTLIDEICQAKNFNELLERTKTKQQTIIKLCQA